MAISGNTKNFSIDPGRVRQFGNIEFLAKQLVEGFVTGLHKSPYHGFSVEFAEHRLYNPGESTRHIDWKVYGKTDRLYTKRYEEETNLRCMLLLDSSPSMFYPTDNYGKITFSIMAAACLAYLLQKQRDAVGVTTFSDQIEITTPVKSTPGHLHTLFLQLEQMLKNQPVSKKTAVSEVLHQIADKINKRSLVILFSDMFENTNEKEELFAALQHLKHNRHEVLLFHIVEGGTEEEFNFPDRPFIFTDLETGEKVKVMPSQVRENYVKSMKSYLAELKLRCGHFGIDLIEADIRKGYDQILLPYLIKRSRMK